MMIRKPSVRLLCSLVLLLIPLLAAAAGLSAAERRGKRIYAEGKGRKPITAFLAGSGLKAPGSAFACANCHLGEGAGTKEGGVQSADITFATLSADLPGVRRSGRAHPPYTEEGLRNAVLGGFDPGGNTLHEAHPRYEISEGDLADLVAYLKVLGREPVPGITEGEVRVAMLLPEQGPLAEAGKSVRALVAASFEEMNARGGLFRRRLSLVPIFFDPAKQAAVVAAVKGPLELEDVFCFLANLGVPPEDKALQRLSAEKVPVIAPLLIALEGGYGTDRTTFHIYASVRDQARVMVDFLGQELGDATRRVALLYASDGAGEAGAAGAREQAKTDALALVAEVSFTAGKLAAPETVRRLKSASAGAVLFFGPGGDAVTFLQEAERQRWHPVFLAPAPMVGASLFAASPAPANAVYLASPVATPDPTSPGMAEFSRLVKKAAVPGEHRSFQLMAYAGAKLLEEGLRRAGRDVTRARLVENLGTLMAFPTGVTPPLSYNENRRVGALGAAIFKLDGDKKSLVPAAPWREPR
ncbi:MAG TPA: ABC transporter substrate-binding protein [Candidatus Methylomirabilis sp.]|nr:ABC transporter substrate-binding protein [Candidatus Methylomirabilis sp.]